jgi:uncharacterized membrane protein YgdD (TMEM256/DUF423 family)
MNSRTCLLAAGIFGASAVILGAFGAHALHALLSERGSRDIWETAVQFHLLHAIALLALGSSQRWGLAGPGARRARAAMRCWSAGIVLFSGSLYGLAAGGPRWLGPVTPLGGLALIAGWIWILAAAMARTEP